jgi:succinate dehydrogenase flavin-adding protein (antitoxin of CptAB toxin-antitoxin module)
MRELDLLLEKFLATGLQSLGIADLDCLEKLLAQPDQDILAWLTAEPKPDDVEIRRIVTILRDRIFSNDEPDD